MKKLMITAAASALMLGAAACSDGDVKTSDASYDSQTTETAEMTDANDTDIMMDDADVVDVETVYLASGELSAGELIGAEVMGVDGEKIATLDDLLINPDGSIDTVVFRSGDFVDLIGTKGALAYDQLDLTMTDDNEPGFTVGMTEDAIQQVAEFDQDGLNDYRLASEMIGTQADFLNSDESVRINDIIISPEGEAKYAVVSESALPGDERQLAFNRISVEQGDGGSIVIDASAQDFDMMPIFKYDRDDD